MALRQIKKDKRGADMEQLAIAQAELRVAVDRVREIALLIQDDPEVAVEEKVGGELERIAAQAFMLLHYDGETLSGLLHDCLYELMVEGSQDARATEVEPGEWRLWRKLHPNGEELVATHYGDIGAVTRDYLDICCESLSTDALALEPFTLAQAWYLRELADRYSTEVAAVYDKEEVIGE